MFDRLTESEQVAHYREVRNRLFYPEGGIVEEEPEYILPEPPKEYDYGEVSVYAAWVARLKYDAWKAQYGKQKFVTISDCQALVCKTERVTKCDLLSQRRSRHIVFPRQLSMYLSRVCTKYSYPEIGRAHGNRDHTTVLHAVKKIERLIATDARYALEVSKLVEILGGEK